MKKEDMNIVIVGHVDHGKSTLIGRLLADTHSLPEGKLEQVRETCRRNSKPFEYAFLLDALKDEQAQGITIDSARCFFKTEKRDYIILDAPGHIEFLKNMITGAARAGAALLLIDAKEGIQENSKRHGYMLSMLGIKQVAVVINKMDLVDYSQEVYEQVKKDYLEFLKQIEIEAKYVLPISAFEGENIVRKSDKMDWYQGECILDIMDLFECEEEKENQIFRMPVQDIYKFTRNLDDRRIVAGTIETGSIKEGDEVIFYPSGKKSHIKSIERFHAEIPEAAIAGMAVGFTLKEQIYLRRGELMARSFEQQPKVSTRIAANIFWLGKKPFSMDKSYTLKIGCDKVTVRMENITKLINSSNLEIVERDYVDTNEVAECILRTERPIAFDLVEDLAGTSRFVLVDGYEISGGGIISKEFSDENKEIRDKVLLRNYKWERSEVSSNYRSERYAQKPYLLILTGEQNVGKKVLAKALEENLLNSGRYVYYLGIGTLLYGMNSDIKQSGFERHDEHIRRFGEITNLMLDAGMILIVTARNLEESDLEIMRTVVDGEMSTIWIGETISTDIIPDIHIRNLNLTEGVAKLKTELQEKNIIFRV